MPSLSGSSHCANLAVVNSVLAASRCARSSNPSRRTTAHENISARSSSFGGSVSHGGLSFGSGDVRRMS